MLLQHPVLIHSSLTPRTRARPSPQQRARTTGSPNPGAPEHSAENSPESLPPETQPLSTDSSRLSTLDNIGAGKKLNNLPVQCILWQQPPAGALKPKSKRGGRLFWARCLEPLKGRVPKLKQLPFLVHPGLWDRGTVTSMSEEKQRQLAASPWCL